MQHTPGPWHIGTLSHPDLIYAESGRMNQGSQGTELYPVAQAVHFPGDDGTLTTEANALLIATAPELLARCKQVLRYLEHPDVLKVTDNFALPGSVIVKHLEQAIAKAEGR